MKIKVVFIELNEETYIDKNYIERNGDGYNFCKVRLRTVRKPVIGDKFSSRDTDKKELLEILFQKKICLLPKMV